MTSFEFAQNYAPLWQREFVEALDKLGDVDEIESPELDWLDEVTAELEVGNLVRVQRGF